MVAVVLVPAVIAAVIGWLVTSLPGPLYSATALVDAGPGATAADALSVPPDRSDRFVQTELVYLSIAEPEIEARIRQETGVADPPAISSQQVETTNIISLSTQYSSAETAAQMVSIATEVYLDGWRERTGADASRRLAAVNAQLEGVTRQLAQLPATGGSSTQEAQRAALESQYQSLTGQRAELELEVANVESVDRVVQQATAETATGSSSPIRSSLLAGLLGLLVGVAALLLLRQRRQVSAAGE